MLDVFVHIMCFLPLERNVSEFQYCHFGINDNVYFIIEGGIILSKFFFLIINLVYGRLEFKCGSLKLESQCASNIRHRMGHFGELGKKPY